MLLISALTAVVVAVCARLTTRRAPMAWLALFTLAAVVVLALTGHAAGSVSHEDAVNSLGVHLLGVVVWTGGLLALVVMRRPLGSDLGPTVARYSTVAAWCFGAVALTGLQQAWIRLGSIDGLFTAYGAVVALKTVAIVTLGVLRLAAPAQHRRGAHRAPRRRPHLRPARCRRARRHGGGHRAGGRARAQRAAGARRGARPEPHPRAERLPRPGADGRGRLAHRVAGRLALPGHRGRGRGPVPRRGRATASARRLVAGAAHRVLGARLGAVRVGHLQRPRHLGAGAVQHAHGDAHGGGDDGAAAARARRARSRSRCGR